MIELKVGKKYSGRPPAALVDRPIPTEKLRNRLRDLGDRVIREGVTGTDAATALLLRLLPAVGAAPGGSLRQDGETAADAAVRLVPALRDSCLPIQGPPGTGKTYTGAEQILALIRAGRAAGITGPSHAVNHHLIANVCEHAAAHGIKLRIGQRAGSDNPYLHDDACSMTPGKLAPAIRSSSPSRARPRTRRAPGPHHWSTSWATARPCRPTPACSSTGPGGCTRACAASPPTSSTTAS